MAREGAEEVSFWYTDGQTSTTSDQTCFAKTNSEKKYSATNITLN